jgi:hypothetical protein
MPLPTSKRLVVGRLLPEAIVASWDKPVIPSRAAKCRLLPKAVLHPSYHHIGEIGISVSSYLNTIHDTLEPRLIRFHERFPMSEQLLLVGAAADADDFKREIESEFEGVICAISDHAPDGHTLDDADYGQFELVELLVTIPVGMVTNAIYDALKAKIRERASMRRLSEQNPAEEAAASDPTDHGA